MDEHVTLADRIKQAVEEEYARATLKHGPLHASAHEAYAVMLEEFEEAAAEAETLKYGLSGLWNATKSNVELAQRTRLSDILDTAERAAAEYVQVAAMARKALMRWCERL